MPCPRVTAVRLRPERYAFSDEPDGPATPLKTHRSLDTGSKPFSGHAGRLLACAAKHIGLDRLATLHQSIDLTSFLGQLVPCDRVLHLSSTYPLKRASVSPDAPEEVGQMPAIEGAHSKGIPEYIYECTTCIYESYSLHSL